MKKDRKKMSKSERHKKMLPLMSFMEMLKRRLATWEDIDDFIEIWHNGSYDCKLHEFLGMSLEEYKLWVMHPHLAHHIGYVNQFSFV